MFKQNIYVKIRKGCKMGKFTVIPENTFKGLQLDAGVLLRRFNPDNPSSPADEDIICATTGGINPSCVPTFSDLGEDVDNVPVNMMELKHLDSWECKISTSSLGTTPELIKLALGCADIHADKSMIVPRADLKQSDFTDLWWVGDRADGGFVAIQLKNALSTGGFSLQTTKNAKGTISLEITGHVSINAQKEVPMVFYSADPSAFEWVTVEAEAPATSIFGYTVSQLQDNVKVDGATISGTLKYIDDGALVPTWGEGNFLALKFSGFDPKATSVKVGLDPSQSSGLVEILTDPDKNGTFKVTDKDSQVLKVVSTDGTDTLVQTYSLSKLILEDAGA